MKKILFNKLIFEKSFENKFLGFTEFLEHEQLSQEKINLFKLILKKSPKSPSERAFFICGQLYLFKIVD